jgi:hypothetical protein
MLAAYLLVLIATFSKLPGEDAWPWAVATAVECEAHRLTLPTCVRFVSYALAEGGFRASVLSGACNLSRSGCDRGHAFGPWQVHPEDARTTGPLLLNPLTGVRPALVYWLRVPGAWSTWRTGEAIASGLLLRFPLASSALSAVEKAPDWLQ